jgi:hypothetical protein
MTYVLRLWAPPDAASASATPNTAAELARGLAEGKPPVLLEYVAWCDVDAFGGRGKVKLTRNRWRAKRFRDAAEAAEYWVRQSRVRPLRDDGEPNGPLTAYNVTMELIK